MYAVSRQSVVVMQLKAMLGSEIADKASNGPKKFEVTVDGDALSNLTGSEFSKSLRYGATLELNKASFCSRAMLRQQGSSH